MNPHYYLMKSKKILRLEWDVNLSSLPQSVMEQLLDNEIISMTQEQANWRVAIFRDEIMEIEEYLHWLQETLEIHEFAN
jgi:hypothetical protein